MPPAVPPPRPLFPGAAPRPRGRAVFSPCGRYRYLLTRSLGPGGGTATFVLLNPSTADATAEDPTVRRCVGFARRWGCGAVRVVNLFAFRATRPRELRAAADPVGPDNPAWLKRTIAAARRAGGVVVCGWGVHGSYRGRDADLLSLLRRRGVAATALAVTRDGHPGHPLYVPYAAPLLPYAAAGTLAAPGRPRMTVATPPAAGAGRPFPDAT